MSQQITAERINYLHNDAEPVRIMRCDTVIDTRLVDGTINISNVDLGSAVEISGDVTVDQIISTVTVSGDVRITHPVEISGTVQVTGEVTISGTVDVSGDVNVTNTVDISGDVNVVNPVEISGSITISNTVTTTPQETDHDAFGRLRVSHPYTLFEFTSIYPFDVSNDLKFDISLTGNASLSNEDSVHILSVSDSGDRAIVQSREYIIYQPGKSRLMYLTGALKQPSGFQGTALLGSFDASFGYAFGCDPSGIFITERNDGSDTKVYQSDWNQDTLDDIRFEKAQIYTVDQEWLGVGQVRLGCIAAGEYRICHKFTHVNELDAPYFKMAKLPIRYEIESDGSSGDLRMICGTVLSEGGFNAMGNKYGTPTFSALTGVGDTVVPLFSLRLKEEYPHINTTIKIQQVDVMNSSGNRLGYWSLVYNPEIRFTTDVEFINNPDPNSSAMICHHVSGDTISGGVVIMSGFLPQKGHVELVMTPDEIVRSQGIGRTIDGTSDTITLAIRRVTNDINVYGTMNWLEIR